MVLKYTKYIQGETNMGEKENILIDYILNNIHSCPFEDDCGIDFTKECVGFREKGCKECIYRNIEKLRDRQ